MFIRLFSSKQRTVSCLLFSSLLLSLPSLSGQEDLSHRKSDLVVDVSSLSGAPLSGATVEVEMLNHAFRFGCAVEYRHIEETQWDYDEWTAETFSQYCNSLTYGNIMKWSYYEDRTEQQMLDILRTAQSFKGFNGPDQMRVRGHGTLWGSAYQVPNDVKNSEDAQYVHDRVIEHVEAYHTTFKDQGIDNFDLYNEPTHERAEIIDKIIGTNATLEEEAEEIASWFKKAKEADPNAVLYINDYNMLNNSWTSNDADIKAYKALIDAVRDAGGDVGGIGLQAHMGNWVSKADIVRRLDLLSEPMAPTANHPEGLPGLPIEITELDIGTGIGDSRGEEGEAELARAVLEAAFEHPAVQGVTIWGMNDAFHWRDNGMLFDDLDEDGETRVEPVLKATGQVWVDLVKNVWWEDHSGSTDSSGEYLANTFKGTHRVKVTFNGQVQEKIIHLDDNQMVTFAFEAEPSDASNYDDWESYVTWGAAASAREEDPDGDGLNNLEEYLYGTDPLAMDATPSISLVNDGAGGHALLFALRSFMEDIDVYLESSTTLAPESWTSELLDLDSLTSESVENLLLYTRDLGVMPNRAFYRLKLVEVE